MIPHSPTLSKYRSTGTVPVSHLVNREFITARPRRVGGYPTDGGAP